MTVYLSSKFSLDMLPKGGHLNIQYFKELTGEDIVTPDYVKEIPTSLEIGDIIVFYRRNKRLNQTLNQRPGYYVIMVLPDLQTMLSSADRAGFTKGYNRSHPEVIQNLITPQPGDDDDTPKSKRNKR
jgi:hypothetical protein